MASWVGKSYKLEKSDNFEKLGQAMGINFALRKIGTVISPTITLTKDGNVYTFTTASTFKTIVIKFTPGEDFEDELPDGKKVPSVCTFENENKLVQIQKGDKQMTSTFEFTSTELVNTLVCGDIVAKRYFKAV